MFQISLWSTKPRIELIMKCIQYWTDWTSCGSAEINVFGVPTWGLKDQFVKGCSPSKGESGIERGIREYLDERAR